MQIVFGTVDGYPLLHPQGRLDAPALRAALLKVAAEEPDAVVCDLRGRPWTADGLTLFLAVLDQLRPWSPCPLVLVAGPSLRARLSRLALDRRAHVVAAPGDAAAAVRSGPRDRRARLELPRSLASVAAARSFAADTLTGWDRAGDADPARLVLTQLVTNAVVHADGPIAVRVSAGARAGGGGRRRPRPG